MSENNKIILALFAGAAAVAAVGLLVSSEKGDVIRREIIDAAKYFSDKILHKEKMEKSRDKSQELNIL